MICKKIEVEKHFFRSDPIYSLYYQTKKVLVKYYSKTALSAE